MPSSPLTRRDFLQKTAIFGAAASTGMGVLQPAHADNFRPFPSQRHALVTWGGWDGHHPETFKDMIVPWLRDENFEVTVANSLEPYADSDLMETVDVVVQFWTMGEISDAQLEGLLTAVQNGTGIAGWHGGIGDSFRNRPRYLYMIGGQWVSHPGGQIQYTVNIVDEEDEITAGIDDFTLTSEQYYMLVDPSNTVLATTTFTGDHDSWIGGSVMPVVWKKRFGQGRVFFSSVGHAPNDFEEAPEAFEIVKRGIRWASNGGDEQNPADLVQAVYPKG
jgi:type 1 glutamine amidotransferase